LDRLKSHTQEEGSLCFQSSKTGMNSEVESFHHHQQNQNPANHFELLFIAKFTVFQNYRTFIGIF
jgi:hypothetical protein